MSRDVPLWEMSREELSEARERARAFERQLLETLFGEGGAAAYRRLERASESVYDRERADAAFAELERMQGSLSEAECNRLFGIGAADDEPPAVEDVDEFIRALDALDFSSEWGLGDSLKYAFIRLGEADEDPERMRAGERKGFAQIRAAAVHVAAEGWDWTTVLATALEGIHGLYDDEEDARQMSRRLCRLIEQGAGGGIWFYEATRGSRCAALAP